MVKLVAAVADRLVRFTAPPVTAKAEASACYNQYCCCVGGCNVPWQNKIRYNIICNGVYTDYFYTSCGACSA